MRTDELYRDCPRCGAPMPVDPGYTTWCHACDWNVSGRAPLQEPVFTHPFARAQQRNADAAARRILEALAAEPGRSTPVTSHAWATALAGLVVLGFVLFTALWVWLTLTLGWIWPVIPLAAGLAVTWLMVPRPARLTGDAREVSEAEFPALWEYVRLMAHECGSRPPGRIVALAEHRAFAGRFGWRGRTVLGLGLPLWLPLGWDERCFVVGHELGHLRQPPSPLARLRWWGRGIAYQAYRIVSPDDSPDRWAPDLLASGEVLVRPVLRLAALLPLRVAATLDAAYARGRQEAELLADRAAAHVVGTEPAVRGLVAMMRVEGFRTVATSAMIRGEDPWVALSRISEPPPREIARLIRAAELSGSRYDALHPRTSDRIELLRRCEEVPTRDVVPLEMQMAVDEEVARLTTELRRRFEWNLRRA